MRVVGERQLQLKLGRIAAEQEAVGEEPGTGGGLFGLLLLVLLG
jgi:hypothetical protein